MIVSTKHKIHSKDHSVNRKTSRQLKLSPICMIMSMQIATHRCYVKAA